MKRVVLGLLVGATALVVHHVRKVRKIIEKSDVIIVNPASLTMKRRLLHDASDLLVIADFDRTLATMYVDRATMTKGLSSYGVVERNPNLPPSYAKTCDELRDKYSPYEYAPELSELQRNALLEQWWVASHQAAIDAKITKEQMNEACRYAIVEKKQMLLRPGVIDLFALLHKHKVPVIVMSAGLKQPIEYLLNEAKILTPNVSVFANTAVFDEKGTIQSFSPQQPIHNGTKTYGAVVKKSSLHAQLLKRRNLILLGDNLTDVRMSIGMEPSQLQCVLNIGFLNDEIMRKISQYRAAFDVLILRDGSMKWVCDLITALLNEPDLDLSKRPPLERQVTKPPSIPKDSSATNLVAPAATSTS